MYEMATLHQDGSVNLTLSSDHYTWTVAQIIASKPFIWKAGFVLCGVAH